MPDAALAATLPVRARLGRAWLHWQGVAFLADKMKQGQAKWIERAVRWGFFDDLVAREQVLLIAITHAQLTIAQAALARGVDPNGTYGGNTFLHWALVAYQCTHEAPRRARSLAILQALLDQGADMECSNRHGRSACDEIEQWPSEIGAVLHAERARRDGLALDSATAPVLATRPAHQAVARRL